MPNDAVWGCHVESFEIDKWLTFMLSLMLFPYRRYRDGRSEVEIGPCSVARRFVAGQTPSVVALITAEKVGKVSQW